MSFKSVLLILLFIFGLILSMALIYLNDVIMPIDFLFFSVRELSLGKTILLAFLLGVLSTIIVELIILFKRKEET